MLEVTSLFPGVHKFSIQFLRTVFDIIILLFSNNNEKNYSVSLWKILRFFNRNNIELILYIVIFLVWFFWLIYVELSNYLTQICYQYNNTKRLIIFNRTSFLINFEKQNNSRSCLPFYKIIELKLLNFI